MYASDILEQLYPEDAKKIKSIYPEFYETATQTKITQWKKEWQEGERNPEVIEKLKELDEKLKNGEISEENADIERDKLVKEPAVRIEGIAFADDKTISFRDEKPSLYIIVHEIGHVHYSTDDRVWNSSYGGAEILFWLGLRETYKINDKNVKRLVDLLERASKDDTYLDVAKEITEKLYPFWKDNAVKSFYAIEIASGIIPSDLPKEIERKALLPNDPDLLNVVPSRSDVWMFIINIEDGLKYGDSFSYHYAKALGLINDKD